ncbi:hypothetical protein GCM10025734_37200 [Kitasatospora paranensis]
MGGDAVDERLERPPLVAVARQGAEHRDADLLDDVVHMVPGAAGQPHETAPAVPDGERVDVGEQGVDGRALARDGGRHHLVQLR